MRLTWRLVGDRVTATGTLAVVRRRSSLFSATSGIDGVDFSWLGIGGVRLLDFFGGEGLSLVIASSSEVAVVEATRRFREPEGAGERERLDRVD